MPCDRSPSSWRLFNLPLPPPKGQGNGGQRDREGQRTTTHGSPWQKRQSASQNPLGLLPQAVSKNLREAGGQAGGQPPHPLATEATEDMPKKEWRYVP
jgi:hypothetical protein